MAEYADFFLKAFDAFMKHGIRIAVVECSKCKRVFYPYGEKPMQLPIRSTVTCPHCNHEQETIWDRELERELARKRLGLDDPLEDKIEKLEQKIQSLESEVSLVRKIAENLSLSKFEEKADEILEKKEKELETSILRLIQTEKKKERMPIA